MTTATATTSHISGVAYTGGRRVTRQELRETPTPPRTPSYSSVPHATVLDDAGSILASYGLAITSEEHVLTRNGGHYFGVFGLRYRTDGDPIFGATGDLLLGLRNSHLRDASITGLLGSRVFMCTNMQYFAEWAVSRQHRGQADLGFCDRFNRLIGDDLPDHIAVQKRFEADARGARLSRAEFAEYGLDCLLRGAMNQTHLRQYADCMTARFNGLAVPSSDRGQYGKSMWAAYNDVTEILRPDYTRINPDTVATRTRHAHDLARRQLYNSIDLETTAAVTAVDLNQN